MGGVGIHKTQSLTPYNIGYFLIYGTKSPLAASPETWWNSKLSIAV